MRGAGDATTLQALIDTEDDVVGDERLKVSDLLNTETTEGSADDVRGKTEEALSNLLDTGVLAVET